MIIRTIFWLKCLNNLVSIKCLYYRDNKIETAGLSREFPELSRDAVTMFQKKILSKNPSELQDIEYEALGQIEKKVGWFSNLLISIEVAFLMLFLGALIPIAIQYLL